MSERTPSSSQGRALDYRRLALQLLVLAAVLVGWNAYVQLMRVPAYLLPGPVAVAEEMWAMVSSGLLWTHTRATLMEVAVGFALGSLLGAVVGFLLSRSPAIEDLIQPYIIFAQTVPKIGLIPLFVVWFGLGIVSKVVLIVSMVFFPVMVNTIVGLRSVPPELREMMRMLKATPLQTLLQVELPSALPLVMAGLRLSIIQAVIGAIVAEWIAGDVGLGFLLIFGSTTYNSTLLVATIIATSLLGVGCYLVVQVVERRLLSWHESASWETEV